MEFFYIQNILDGDVVKFTWFVDKYKNMAFTIAFRITNNNEDAEEVVQDAFLKAYRSLHKFRQDAKFSTWLYKIVVNTSLSKIKNSKIFTQQSELIDIEDIAIDNIEDAYQRLTHSEQKKIIHEALGTMNIEDRLLLTLYYLQEISIDEIEEITGIRKENIKMKLHRARKKMYTSFQKK